MIDITLENFQDELIEASLARPVLLDIWAEWCGPCKQLGPVLEKLEVEYAGRFTLAKLDADKVPQISSQLSEICLLYTSPSPRDLSTSRMPSSA